MTSSIQASAIAVPAIVRKRSPRTVNLRKHWLTIMAGAFIVIVVVSAIAAPLVAPFDPLEIYPEMAFSAPSLTNLFGTDELGRDILSRAIFGARVSVGTAAAVVLVASIVGLVIGMIAGYTGGWVDTVIMRLIDTILAFPAVLLALALIAILGRSVVNSAIAVIIVSIPAFARLVRSIVLQQQELEYVQAARIIGATELRIMTRTLLPNVIPPLLVQIAINATWAIQLEAGLSYLGLGVKPPDPSWGQMLSVSRDQLYRAPWYGLFVGLLLVLLVLALNILADAIQKYYARGRIL